MINHAKFQLDRFRDFRAPGGLKLLSPVDRRYRPYTLMYYTVIQAYSICSTHCTAQIQLGNLSRLCQLCVVGIAATYGIVWPLVKGCCGEI